MVSLSALIISCSMGDNTFIASGYSGDGAADVLVCRLNGNGNIEKLSETTVGDNPSHFTFGREGLIYLVNEVDTFNMKAGGGITTLHYDKKSKSLEKVSSINQGGGGPCHIEVSVDGKCLITANYGSGSVSVEAAQIASGGSVYAIEMDDYDDYVAAVGAWGAGMKSVIVNRFGRLGVEEIDDAPIVAHVGEVAGWLESDPKG